MTNKGRVIEVSGVARRSHVGALGGGYSTREAGIRDQSGALTPPDLTQCQAQIPWALTADQLEDRVRCASKPVVVAREKRSGGPDGQLASMSLCEGCREHLVKELGHDFFFDDLSSPE